MKRQSVFAMMLAVLFVVTLRGYADQAAADAVRAAGAVAWSLDEDQLTMTVAISPVRQTLQIVGSAATVLGAGISAVANEKYRKAIEEALQGYDTNAVIRDRIEARLNTALSGKAKRVGPMGSTAGASDVRAVEKERLARLAALGQDAALDLTAEYGLFGYQGLLITKLTAKLHDTKTGRMIWSDTLLSSAEDILASDKLKDPTNQLAPNLMDPRFSVAEDAVAQWTGDGGATFRKRFEAAVDGCVSALLLELGLVQEPAGAYYLGRVDLLRKDFANAENHFKLALQLDPANVAAKNGLSVTLAHDKRLDDAMAMAKEIAESAPDFGPACYNLAWWYAVEKKDSATAKPYYERARMLGMPAAKKLEKALGG